MTTQGYRFFEKLKANKKKRLYIFQEDKENERTETLDQFPFASYSLQKLKKALLKKFKYPLVFQKKYGAVLWLHTGDVLGWIRIVGRMV